MIEDHYTTAYDLYPDIQRGLLNTPISGRLLRRRRTRQITLMGPESVSRTWKCSNQFYHGERDTPEGVTVLGGKTGTTKTQPAIA